MYSSLFDQPSNTSCNCHPSDDKHPSPITYETFIKQQQNQMTCYCCSLYKNKTLFSPHLIDNNTHIDIIKEEPIEYNATVPPTLPSLPLLLPKPIHNINQSLDFSYPLTSTYKTIDKNVSLTNTSKTKRKTQANLTPYVCPYAGCGKIYNRLFHFNTHKRAHLGIKPHSCTWPECGWKFARSDELTRHFR